MVCHLKPPATPPATCTGLHGHPCASGQAALSPPSHCCASCQEAEDRRLAALPRKKCWTCEEEIVCDPETYGDTWSELEVYDDPWQKEPTVIAVHIDNGTKDDWCSCEDYATEQGGYDFSYWHCQRCERLVCQRCPSNGWHEYFRLFMEHDEVEHFGMFDIGNLCLACYEEVLFEKGMPASHLADDSVHGMFFNMKELEEHGFEEVKESYHSHITGGASVRELKEKMRELAAKGMIVLCNYDSMGIGGLEGFVTLYAKPREATADCGAA